MNADGIDVEIKNASDKAITNLEFTTSEKLEVLKIDRIDPNETVEEFLSMEENESDGIYVLTFSRSSGENEISAGGYYTNGGSLDNKVVFIVKNDTTILNFDPSNY